VMFVNSCWITQYLCESSCLSMGRFILACALSIQRQKKSTTFCMAGQDILTNLWHNQESQQGQSHGLGWETL
jgi:hypothetical protein